MNPKLVAFLYDILTIYETQLLVWSYILRVLIMADINVYFFLSVTVFYVPLSLLTEKAVCNYIKALLLCHEGKKLLRNMVSMGINHSHREYKLPCFFFNSLILLYAVKSSTCV